MAALQFTSKNIFLVLIAVVGCGLVLSMMRMSMSPAAPQHGSIYQSGSERELGGSDLAILDVGPTDTLEEEGERFISSNSMTEDSITEYTATRAVDISETTTPPLSSLGVGLDATATATPTPTEATPTEYAASEPSFSSASAVDGETEPVITRQKHVLLLTEGRSGSTWLSSFFWNQKTVYYTFEPLFHEKKSKAQGCHDSDEERRSCDDEILSHLWGCDFTSSQLATEGRYPNYRKNCSDFEDAESHGGACSKEMREEQCKKATHNVAKVILLFDLSNIEDIVKRTSEYDVRVIHLVRDPRPLVRSRSSAAFGTIDGINKHPAGRAYTDEERYDQSATLCKRMLENSKLGDNPPEWLKDRYIRIRHEELSLHPVEIAKKLYQHVDLPWSETAEEFIYNTTIVGKGGMFGIGRVSADVVNKWKRPPGSQEVYNNFVENIRKLTEVCLPTIEYLGYETDMDKILNYQFDENEVEEEEEEEEQEEEGGEEGEEEGDEEEEEGEDT